MIVKIINKNCQAIYFSTGVLLVSYQIPVGIILYQPNISILKSLNIRYETQTYQHPIKLKINAHEDLGQKISKTTQRHLNNNGFRNAQIVSQVRMLELMKLLKF